MNLGENPNLKCAARKTQGGEKQESASFPWSLQSFTKGLKNNTLKVQELQSPEVQRSWGKQPCSGTAIYAGPLQLEKRCSCLLGCAISKQTSPLMCWTCFLSSSFRQGGFSSCQRSSMGCGLGCASLPGLLGISQC